MFSNQILHILGCIDTPAKLESGAFIFLDKLMFKIPLSIKSFLGTYLLSDLLSLLVFCLVKILKVQKHEQVELILLHRANDRQKERVSHFKILMILLLCSSFNREGIYQLNKIFITNSLDFLYPGWIRLISSGNSFPIIKV